MIDQAETVPIETHQAVLRADPEVAIRRLSDGIDCATGKRIVAPASDYVLVEGAVRVEREKTVRT